MARMYVGDRDKQGMSFIKIARERNRDPRTVGTKVKAILNGALDLYETVMKEVK